jgi:long-chain acyl-CoA synthetase
VRQQVFTYAEFDTLARRLAGDLRRRGTEPSDRLAFVLPNSAEFAALYFASIYLGATVVPINPILHRSDVEYILRAVAPKFLVYSDTTGKQVEGARAEFETLRLAQPGEQGGADAWITDEIPERVAAGWEPFDLRERESLLCIAFTSGTTERPKGVAHRLRPMMANARAFCQQVGLGDHHRFYNVLPMAYMAGFYNLLLLPYLVGGSVVIDRTFDAQSAIDFWSTPAKWEVNALWLVPSICSILLSLDRGELGERFCRTQVDKALVGTAALPLPLRRRFEKRYGVDLLEGYGLSEALFVATQSGISPSPVGSVGRALPGVQVSALELDSDEPVRPGSEGELTVSTPHLMVGYYNPDTKQPDELRAGEPLRTGDVGYVTAEGEIFVTGRKKDLIIRAGINVSPRAIEVVLMEHPEVQDAAVVGVPHPVYGEEIAAVVRLSSGRKIDQVRSAIGLWCEERLGAANQPAYLLDIGAFPVSSSGKVNKAALRQLVMGKLGLRVPEPTAAKGEPQRGGIARVRRTVTRPSPELLSSLCALPPASLSRALGEDAVLDPGLKLLGPSGSRVCGPAVTVELYEKGTRMAHLAIQQAQPGDVLVVSPDWHTPVACWDVSLTKAAKAAKVAGVIVLGSAFGTEAIQDCGLAVWAHRASAVSAPPAGAGTVNLPLTCGELVVEPGDIILAGEDGVLLIPAFKLETTLARAREEDPDRGLGPGATDDVDFVD